MTRGGGPAGPARRGGVGAAACVMMDRDVPLLVTRVQCGGRPRVVGLASAVGLGQGSRPIVCVKMVVAARLGAVCGQARVLAGAIAMRGSGASAARRCVGAVDWVVMDREVSGQ